MVREQLNARDKSINYGGRREKTMLHSDQITDLRPAIAYRKVAPFLVNENPFGKREESYSTAITRLREPEIFRTEARGLEESIDRSID